MDNTKVYIAEIQIHKTADSAVFVYLSTKIGYQVSLESDHSFKLSHFGVLLSSTALTYNNYSCC